MRLQAEKWGIKFDAATSHQRLQPLVVARAATEYEQQFKAAVDAAWQAACAAAKPDDQPTTTTGSASTAEPTKAGEQPMAEQPKEAEARPSASSLWELSAPKPLGQLDNMALAGVPVKPRCKQCNCLLDNGCCVEPDCSMFLVESAMEDGQPVEAELSKADDSAMETEPPKAGEQAKEDGQPVGAEPSKADGSETEPPEAGEQAMEAEPPMAEQPMAEPTKADDSAKEAEPTCSDSSGVGGKKAKAEEASKAGKKKPTTTGRVRAISHDPPLSTKPAWQPTAKPIAEPAAKPIAEPADKPKGRTGGEAASSSGTRTSPRLSARNPPAQAPPAAGQPQPAGRPAWHPPDVVRMVTISADPPEPSENPSVAVEDESEDSNDRRRAARIQSQLKLSFK